MEGVAALNLARSTLVHVFDCGKDSSEDLSNLAWEKEVGLQRFPTSYEEIMIRGRSIRTFRMTLPVASDIDDSDLGVYTCIDTTQSNQQNTSINVTGGIKSIESNEPAHLPGRSAWCSQVESVWVTGWASGEGFTKA